MMVKKTVSMKASRGNGVAEKEAVAVQPSHLLPRLGWRGLVQDVEMSLILHRLDGGLVSGRAD
jgi:hypothetical protein